MDKKNIQKNRIIKYFMEATTAIINEEGLSGLSARKVGDKAGYSYATIYNYFPDFKALLTEVAFEQLELLGRLMVNDITNPVEAIRTSSLTYFEFFANNPEWFKLIFIEDLGDHPLRMMEQKQVLTVGKILFDQLSAAAKLSIIQEDKINYFHQLITASIHGKLLFYVYKRMNESKEILIRQLNDEINTIFEVCYEKE